MTRAALTAGAGCRAPSTAVPTRDATRTRTPLRGGTLVGGLALLGGLAGAAAKAGDESGSDWLAQLAATRPPGCWPSR